MDLFVIQNTRESRCRYTRKIHRYLTVDGMTVAFDSAYLDAHPEIRYSGTVVRLDVAFPTHRVGKELPYGEFKIDQV